MKNPFVRNCSECTTKCDGVSKGTYIFMSDVEYSEEKENLIIDWINRVDGFVAQKSNIEGFPDIEVNHIPSGRVFFIEIKSQRRTFMKVNSYLPNSDLLPSETLALNLSDLLRYFDIGRQINRPIFILWCLENRPCLVPNEQTRFFYQDSRVLESIFINYGDYRRFRRKSGDGDMVNGEHKGVVVNYHFSLFELIELQLEDLLWKGIE